MTLAQLQRACLYFRVSDSGGQTWKEGRLSLSLPLSLTEGIFLAVATRAATLSLSLSPSLLPLPVPAPPRLPKVTWFSRDPTSDLRQPVISGFHGDICHEDQRGVPAGYFYLPGPRPVPARAVEWGLMSRCCCRCCWGEVLGTFFGVSSVGLPSCNDTMPRVSEQEFESSVHMSCQCNIMSGTLQPGKSFNKSSWQLEAGGFSRLVDMFPRSSDAAGVTV